MLKRRFAAHPVRLGSSFLVVAMLMSGGCADQDPAANPPTKAEASALAKADWPLDFCELLGWYEDDECDEFCEQPDPVCPGEFDPCAGRSCRELCEYPDNAGEFGYCTLDGACVEEVPLDCPEERGPRTILDKPPLGTYGLRNATSYEPDDLTLAVFLEHGRYHLEYGDGATSNGIYRFSGDADWRRLAFYGPDQGLVAELELVHYRQIVDGRWRTRIDLRPVGASHDWHILELTDSWCQVADDCALQGDGIPAYCGPGDWLCGESNRCSFECLR